MENASTFSRRALLKTGGALVVSVGTPLGLDAVLAVDVAQAQSIKPPLLPDELSSYVAIDSGGGVSAYYGKTDTAQGVFAAIGQIVAEELDVPFARVEVVMGDTATTVNQGGASRQSGIQSAGRQLRVAAAEARRVLIEMAAARLNVPPETLTVRDGIISDGRSKVAYAELIGGRYFNIKLDWNKRIGNELYAPGKAKPKLPKDYRVVGQSIPRRDIAPKVYASEDFVTDVKLPGMVHGRVIRPPVAGAVPISVDESSIRDIPGVKVVREKDFIGVVADKEWDAVKAAQKLTIKWSDAKPPFVEQAILYDHIRNAPVRKRVAEHDDGPKVDEAFRNAARVIAAEYEWPFQSHASMGPACAVVEIKDGKATLWTGSAKSHYARDGVAAILGLPPDKVRGIWKPGAGAYGRNDAGDAAMDAAVLAKHAGRPVRLQYMRADATGWDPKAPAYVQRARAAIDASGNVAGYEFITKGFSVLEVYSNESKPRDTLAGQLLGVSLQPTDMSRVPGDSYAFPNKRLAWETIPPMLDRASPLRTAHMRDPGMVHFGSECFVDEVAAALGIDPVEFRLRHIREPRDAAVVKAAAEASGWQPRPSPRRGQTGRKLSGRGISYAYRDGTRAALVAEVEIDRSTGRVWARKFTVAQDSGLIINPDGLKRVIEGNVVQGLSRTLLEEVKFDADNVVSIDWQSYPILDIVEAPETIDCVLINRPDVEASGAGEAAMRSLAAAVGNAIFDATGVRMRRAPFTAERVKAALL
ncbi:MAG TPA: molybdopterin cofactor-binding domain-containing protein [Xanthobacteraceae bacterium]